MLFQTPAFLVLFLVVLGWLLCVRKLRAQHLFLTLASYVFYGWWDIRFVLLIVLSTVIDYTAALGVQGEKISAKKRFLLSLFMSGAAVALLVPNWPELQQHSLQSWLEHPFFELSKQNLIAIGAALSFSIIGPLLFGLYFRLSENARRKAFLITSLVANLGMLAFFKYFNFFIDNVESVVTQAGFEWAMPTLAVTLPVGISFYTFQTMSYTIDAYRGHIKAERSLLRVALYVSYFPQLVAGPIIRPQQLLPTLDKPWTVSGQSLRCGMNLAMVGLVKKVLIADNIAPLVETIFAYPQGQSSLVIMLGAALFAVQIYCDFSGYTDIARGISRVFGVNIPINFNFPYFSTSIIEFWRRWHISLSTWLRDYLYIPLGGSKKGISATYFNLMATMLLGGLWHGASWNFVIWGGYQGALLCANRVLRALAPEGTLVHKCLTSKPGTLIRWGFTTYAWLLGWLIFRINNFDDLLYCMRKFILFDGRLSLGGLGLGRGSPATSFLAVAFFVAFHFSGFVSKRWDERLNTMPLLLRSLVYALLGFLFFYGWPSANAAFIYFQF